MSKEAGAVYNAPPSARRPQPTPARHSQPTSARRSPPTSVKREKTSPARREHRLTPNLEPAPQKPALKRAQSTDLHMPRPRFTILSDSDDDPSRRSEGNDVDPTTKGQEKAEAPVASPAAAPIRRNRAASLPGKVDLAYEKSCGTSNSTNTTTHVWRSLLGQWRSQRDRNGAMPRRGSLASGLFGDRRGSLFGGEHRRGSTFGSCRSPSPESRRGSSVGCRSPGRARTYSIAAAFSAPGGKGVEKARWGSRREPSPRSTLLASSHCTPAPSPPPFPVHPA